MKAHTVKGGGGLRLHVREWGNVNGPPILFIHGWSQNHLCWEKQVESTLAGEFRLVAYDLRGHGMSDAPLEPEHYTDGRLWADDVAAIVDQLRARPAGARRLVLRRLRHLRLRARVRPGSNRRDRVRRGRDPARRVVLRHADRPRLPRPLRRRDGGRPADQHPRHALLREDLHGEAALGRRLRDRALLEHRGAGADPRQPGGARDGLRRRAARSRGADARHARPGGLGRATGDGRARPRHLRRPPRPPGTTASVTPRTSRSRSASTASWPS